MKNYKVTNRCRIYYPGTIEFIVSKACVHEYRRKRAVM